MQIKESEVTNEKFLTEFFEVEHRKKNSSTSQIIKNFCEIVFENIYIKFAPYYQNKKEEIPKTLKDHTFLYNLFIENENQVVNQSNQLNQQSINPNLKINYDTNKVNDEKTIYQNNNNEDRVENPQQTSLVNLIPKNKNNDNTNITNNNHVNKTENELTEVTEVTDTTINDDKKKEYNKILPSTDTSINHVNHDNNDNNDNNCNKAIDKVENEKLEEIHTNNDNKMEKETVEEADYSKCIDSVMIEYLKYISFLTNQNQFFMMFKFIVLFRDSVNLNNIKELDNKRRELLLKDTTQKFDVFSIKEYTTCFKAERLPEFANDYFAFLEKSNNYGWESDLEKFELIELMQHFCFWLFSRKYTFSKLSVSS